MTVYFGRSVWGYALSSDPVVVERIALLLPLLSIMIPADGANAAYSGKGVLQVPLQVQLTNPLRKIALDHRAALTTF